MLQVLNNTSADAYSPRSNWALDDTSVPPRRFEVSPQVSAGPNERVDGDDDQNDNPGILGYAACTTRPMAGRDEFRCRRRDLTRARYR